MDEKSFGYLLLFLVGGSTGLFLIAATIIFQKKNYWASLLSMIGSLTAGLAWFLLLALAIGSNSGDTTLANSNGFLVSMGIIALIGIMLSLVGLIGLCARFRSSQKRLSELEQIAFILEQAQTP